MGGHFDLLEVGSSLVMGHTCRNSMEIFFQMGFLLANFFFSKICVQMVYFASDSSDYGPDQVG